MRSWTIGFLLLAACSFNPSTNSGVVDPNEPDADPNAPDADPNAPDADPNAPDANPNAPDAQPCDVWSKEPTLFTPCSDVSPSTTDVSLNLPGRYRYNTETHELQVPGESPVTPTFVEIGGATAIVVGQFSIAAGTTLRATGTRPLMIIAWSDILIDGEIDVSSRPNPTDPDNPDADLKGAGANAALCNPSAEGTTNAEGGGGGGGGGFGSVGGLGGHGDGGNVEGGDGGLPATLPPSLRGGCGGAAGGQGNGAGKGQGAPGGGAVYLNARTSITINGTIHAGGQGGHRATGGRSAGGGAGSGGLVGLEAPVITLGAEAILAANGGGGGGGGNNNSTKSKSGASGRPSATLAAPGGDGESAMMNNPNGSGANGGYVGDDMVVTKEGWDGSRGGGGGGGGVGVVILSATSAPTIDGAAQISPAQIDSIAPN